jgi:septum formation topological specificity factor MinE
MPGLTSSSPSVSSTPSTTSPPLAVPGYYEEGEYDRLLNLARDMNLLESDNSSNEGKTNFLDSTSTIKVHSRNHTDIAPHHQAIIAVNIPQLDTTCHEFIIENKENTKLTIATAQYGMTADPHIVITNTTDAIIHLNAKQCIAYAYRIVEEPENDNDIQLLSDDVVGTMMDLGMDVDNEALRKVMNTQWTQEERAKWIIEEFRLNEVDELNKNENVKSELIKLLDEYLDIVSVSLTDYGKTDLIELNIRLKENVMPYRGRVKAMNPLFDAELRGQLDAWLKTDVITPVCSEWAHNVVISIKKMEGHVSV